MTSSGSNSLRFDKTERSAWTFLDAILGRLKYGENEGILNDNVLQIQNKLAVLNRTIPETPAGNKLRSDLVQLLEKLKEANSEQAAALSASIEKQIAEMHSKSFRIVFAFMANFAFGRVEIPYVVSSTCCA